MERKPRNTDNTDIRKFQFVGENSTKRAGRKQSVSPQKLHRRKQRKRLRKIYSKAQNGRSDRTQTCGLMVPNHPRYQLRHAPIYLIIPQKIYFCKWSNLWSNRFYRGFCERTERRRGQFFFDFFVKIKIIPAKIADGMIERNAG